MKIIIDTSNKHLFILLIKNGKNISYKLIKDLVKKADALPKVFLEVLGKYKTKDIKEFYITIGPGSFTGSRTALVFVRSICQITKAKIFVTSSIQLIAGPKGEKEIFIDARSNMSYYGIVLNGKLKNPIKIIPFKPSTNYNYDELIKSPNEYLVLFNEVKNILELKPLYIKKPNIG
ncbi:MAG: hypothetical protein GY679_03590 [Mycoplasma sp.]|nr:hypothetical protein [Mycoplasma sp.]